MEIELIILEEGNILVSNEKITSGSWYYLEKVGRIGSPSGVYQSGSEKSSKMNTLAKNCKRLIASDNVKYGLPNIDYNGFEGEFISINGDLVKNFAKEAYKKHSVKDDRLSLDEQIQRSGGFNVGFIEGFKKAQSIDDKKFSLEDMKKAFFNGGTMKDEDEFDYYIKSIQKNKTFNVKVEMDEVFTGIISGGLRVDDESQPPGLTHHNEFIPRIMDNKIKIVKKH